MPTIKTRFLEIDYSDDGPRERPVVLLLHGWPDDASTWDRIIPVLNEAGFRTIAPTTRGSGLTRFLAADTPRTGNTAMLAFRRALGEFATGVAVVTAQGKDDESGAGRQNRRSNPADRMGRDIPEENGNVTL